MTPFSRRSYGLRFRLFGFPVSIDATFLLIAVLIGLTSNADADVIAVWIGVIAGSLLVHELGHAFAARRLGAEPSIALFALGGLTTFEPPRPLGRAETIGVSLAGPFAGAAVGAVVGLVALAVGIPDTGLTRFALLAAIWVNLGWGMINLLPVLPLDGGHVLLSLLPGKEDVRERRAAGVSVVFAVAAAVVLFMYDLWFGAILFVLFAALNFSRVRRRRDERPQAEAWTKAAEVERMAMGGDPRRARQLLAELDGSVDPALYALVTVCESDGRLGLPELRETYERSPTPARARWLAMGLARSGREAEIAGAVRDGSRETLAAAQHAAHVAGAYDGAVAVGRLMIDRLGDTEPLVHYNIACSLARLGRADDALAELRKAIDGGFADAELMDTDIDLALVRTHPDFASLRDRL